LATSAGIAPNGLLRTLAMTLELTSRRYAQLEAATYYVSLLAANPTMSFMRITSPHAHTPGNTGDVMKQVILATLPGLIALSYFFGPGSLLNVIMASTACVAVEACILKMRQRPLAFYIKDYSATVTGVLLGLALPPYCPWWIVVIGAISAIGIAKHLYGGMGYNPFNPAMIAYVILLISFPLEMSQWAEPQILLAEGKNLISLPTGLSHVFFNTPLTGAFDAWTGATPLDILKQNKSLLIHNLYTQESMFSRARWAGAGWEWINIAFLLGGCYLLYKKIFTWHAPVAMLAILSFCALLGYDGGSSASLGSPLFHLLSGGTMLGAFFIVTDPVTSAVSTRGRLIYGACIGLLIYLIRSYGNYPDAIAFAVLLMNFAAPFIDYYTLPRSYGHKTSKRATLKQDV